MDKVVDFTYLVEIGNFLFGVLVLFVIVFLGAFTSDIWYTKTDNQPINFIQDIIVGIFFSVALNVADFFIPWDNKIYFSVAFFVGIFGIDFLGFIFQPKFFMIFIKHLFAELKNPAAKALSNTAKEIKEEKKKEEAEEKEAAKNNASSNAEKQEEIQENEDDTTHD